VSRPADASTGAAIAALLSFRLGRDEVISRHVLALIASFAVGSLSGLSAARAAGSGWFARNSARRAGPPAQGEQLYRTMADLSPEIIWLTDADGRTVYLNRAWHEIVGPREGGWMGLRWTEAMHPDDREAAMQGIERAMQQGQRFHARFRLRDVRGLYRSFLSAGAPVLDAEGEVAWWVGVCTDVTELEQRERELQALNDEICTFSYTVSHDLRAPLHVIRGFVDALVAGEVGRVDEAARGYLRRVLRNAGRMDELIDDLLMLARLSRETPRLQRFDVMALAFQAMEAVRERYAGRVVQLLAAPALQIVADPRLMRVLLENLLDNAVKFSPGAGVCQVEVSGWLEVDELVLCVADRGVGFPADMASRLFQPFQRLHLDKDFPGTGVGLATVASVARLHHGCVQGLAREGGGTVFKLRMPVLAEDLARAPMQRTEDPA
jgi:PAS domain S-box-containing protein